MGPMPLARNWNAWRSFNQDIELLHSMSLEWHEICVKYCQGVLFILTRLINEINPMRFSLVIFSNGNLEIRPHPCHIEWPAFESSYRRPRYRNHFALLWRKKRRESMRAHTIYFCYISIFISHGSYIRGLINLPETR